MPPKKRWRPLFQSPNQTRTGEYGRRRGRGKRLNENYGKSIKRKSKRQSLSDFPPVVSPNIAAHCNIASPNTESLTNDPIPKSLYTTASSMTSSMQLDLSTPSCLYPPSITSSPFYPPIITASPDFTGQPQAVQPSSIVPTNQTPPFHPLQPATTQCRQSPAVNILSSSFDNEDLLFGLCPEDLSFSLNNSMLVESAKTPSVKTSSGSNRELQPTNTVFDIQSEGSKIHKMPGEHDRLVSQSTANSIDPSNKQQLFTTSLEKGSSTSFIPVSPLFNVKPQNSLQTQHSYLVTHSTPLSNATSRANPILQESEEASSPLGCHLDNTMHHTQGIIEHPPNKVIEHDDGRGDFFEEVFVPESPGVCEDKVSYPDGTFYGLPLTVKACLNEYRGIEKLYDWQHTCLCLPSVIEGSNLIYSLPTSGGKTLVAEIIILQQLLVAGKDVLFILPFVSIVQEKVRELSPFAVSLGFVVEEYAASKGRIPPRNRRTKHVIYIATIEKANGLVNSLVEMERISSLGLVVVDELHMIGDGTVRGATLEVCLAKVLHCSGDTQVVGMSATLSNIDELARFLRAEVYSNDFRPVELLEYVKIGMCVYSVDGRKGDVINLNPVRDILDEIKMDPDQLCSLVAEVVPQSSCLVFCPTKKNCQNVALLLAKYLPKATRHTKQAARQNLLKLLNFEAAGVCPILAQTVPSGIAYHHSGLTADERRIVEEGYLEGALCLLACTSTLAAGVNLPAKRVILRSPFIGNKFLSRSQYKQMIGRAGRSGLCEKGESILILREQDKNHAVEMLFSGPYDSCTSSLLSTGSSIFMSLILSLIGLKVVKTFVQLKCFLCCTLLSIQTNPAHLDKSCEDALSMLMESGYITMETGDSPTQSSYCITSLGRATYKGCLPVEQVRTVYDDLMKGQQGLVLATDLHLLFLTTPPDLCTSIRPNWMIYFEKLTSLGSDELKVAELVGVKPGVLSKKATGISGKMSTDTQTLYHRFYLSLILHHLLKTTSSNTIWRTANYFQCSRGFLQSVMNSTASFSSCLTHFTQEIPELWSINLLLPVITKKLAFSASLDLVPLMEITGVKQGRARQLISAGINTPQQLASSDPQSLCENIEHLYLKQARKLIQAAKRCISEQAEVLMEEAEELMSLVPSFRTLGLPSPHKDTY